nr:hypothetical protein [Tanacetum cinerariifolium]
EMPRSRGNVVDQEAMQSSGPALAWSIAVASPSLPLPHRSRGTPNQCRGRPVRDL